MTLGSQFVSSAKTAALSVFLFASLDVVAAPSEASLQAARAAATNDQQRDSIAAYGAKCGLTPSSSGASAKLAL